jgi:hypothetical protein
VKVFGKEIGRTSVCANTFEPIWNEKFERQYEDLALLEKTHDRPFFMESFDIEVYEVSRSNSDKHTKMFESRIPFTNIGTFKGYKLLKTTNYEFKSGSSHFELGRIFIRINRLYTSDNIYKNISNFSHCQLSDACPPSSPYYRHLYLDFDWSPMAFTYRSGLPGPTSGELLIDKFDLVEV